MSSNGSDSQETLDYLNRDLLGESAPPAYTRTPLQHIPPYRRHRSRRSGERAPGTLRQNGQTTPGAYPPVQPSPVSPINTAEGASTNPFRAARLSTAAHTVRDDLAEEPGVALPQSQRLVVSLDFGTTFTGFAFARTAAAHEADLARIEVLQDWTPKMSNLEKVPSVKSYTSPVSGEAQWGTDLSENAVTMVNQKLELEIQDDKLEELDLTLYVLRGAGYLSFEHVQQAGPNPDFSCKAPEEIVKDYLQHIFECARTAMNEQQLARTNTAIDLVITVPVSWSYQAYNLMFKAVRKAGFSQKILPTLKDTIMVTEPEAAAYFTAREHKDRGTDFLQEGHCFILCDAGGGTVDAVAYQVKKVRPFLELEKATEPTGRKCGSALIDTAFKGWLRGVLGRDDYAKLDPINARQQRISPHTAETAAMRSLIKQFCSRKEVFSNGSRAPIKLDLPAPLDTLNVPGRIDQGELTLPWKEMKDLMDTCVNGAVELVLDQRKRVRRGKGRRIKNVFLVGGFGASPYLQEELAESLALLEIQLRRPDADKCLTAVVQGGVIYGVEKSRHQNVNYMRSAPRSYGIVSEKGYFQWLIKKGDLIFSNKTEIVQSSVFYEQMKRKDLRGGYRFGVFMYNESADDFDNDLPAEWQTGQYEVSRVGFVSSDFREFLSGAGGQNLTGPDGRPHRAAGTVVPGDPRFDDFSVSIGPFQWRMKLSETAIEAELLLLKGMRTGRCVGSCRIHLTNGRGAQNSVEDGAEDPDDW